MKPSSLLVKLFQIQETRGITAGPDGNLWFVECASNKFGKITTAGVVTEFPSPSACPAYIVTGSDGNLWFTEALPSVPTSLRPF